MSDRHEGLGVAVADGLVREQQEAILRIEEQDARSVPIQRAQWLVHSGKVHEIARGVNPEVAPIWRADV